MDKYSVILVFGHIGSCRAVPINSRIAVQDFRGYGFQRRGVQVTGGI